MQVEMCTPFGAPGAPGAQVMNMNMVCMVHALCLLRGMEGALLVFNLHKGPSLHVISCLCGAVSMTTCHLMCALQLTVNGGN